MHVSYTFLSLSTQFGIREVYHIPEVYRFFAYYRPVHLSFKTENICAYAVYHLAPNKK